MKVVQLKENVQKIFVISKKWSVIACIYFRGIKMMLLFQQNIHFNNGVH